MGSLFIPRTVNLSPSQFLTFTFPSPVFCKLPVNSDHYPHTDHHPHADPPAKALKKTDPVADTTELEAETDQLVYQLCELTQEEIAIVENG